MTDAEKSNYLSYLKLAEELHEYRVQGTALFLNGRVSNPEEIAQACILCEDAQYMREYITDRCGHVFGLDFTYVEHT